MGPGIQIINYGALRSVIKDQTNGFAKNEFQYLTGIHIMIIVA